MSAKTFSPKFRPQEFKGPHAVHYPDRDDLFQQLVGAVLRELYLQRESVSSTKGSDGGIDIFIEASNDAGELFYDLRFPIIVECKDHDDSLGTVTRNVEAGWLKVKEKLTRHAKTGWLGTYQPWRRAQGYLYCISATLHQQARDKLTQSIQEFFSSLPPEQKPPVEKIHILDWNDLAPLLNRHPRLADAWLGTNLEGIVGHAAYDASLSGFRLYLKEEMLSFIPPAQDDPTHPINLLTSLEQKVASPGILIIGPGGVGKTRTCLEVAGLANRKGWRVLHLLPGEPPVTVSNLQEIVLQGCTPTLLVIDYLDQMGSLDFGTIRHRLLPETLSRGINLAFLANARPGLLHKANPERDALFHRIDLDIKDRRALITAHIQETIAPQASTVLGSERVREICGTRPIIGMFIARELERYALEGKLDETVVSRLRHGDLQGWIRKRLEEDGLVPQETHPLLSALPDPVMTAVAAGFAAAPLLQPEMVRVISGTLAATGITEATDTTNSVIASLKRSGWLEETGHLLTTPHNVIADELLELTLCDRERYTVRTGIPDKLFIVAREMPRFFGHLSVALDRVVGQKDFPEQVLRSIKETVSAWLVRYASEMGKVFTAANPDEVSYALGAVLTGTTWSDAALRSWDDLVAPWLALHSRSAEARHLLYRGLKELPEHVTGILSDMAIQWLDVFSSSLDATYVLQPLLARQDLDKQTQPAINAAIDWLAEYGSKLEARFVLQPLLERQDLGDQAQPTINTAMDWLTEYGSKLEARFVLSPLLARQDLDKQTQRAINAAIDWLTEYGSKLEAEFVLSPLLARQDLDKQTQRAINAAIDWLAEYGSKLEARFVLHPLLERQDLGDQAQPTINTAMDWLTEHGSKLEAGFILQPLLARQDLDKHTQPAINVAMDWLEEHFLTQDAEFVLQKLLGKSHLTGERKERCIILALKRLDKVIETTEASFLLRTCLKEKTLTAEQWTHAVECALKWLRLYAHSTRIDFVVKRLLRNPLLEDKLWREVADYAFVWLRRTPLAPDRDYALNSLITRLGCLTLEEKMFLLKDAQKWIQAFPNNRGKQRLLINLKPLITILK